MDKSRKFDRIRFTIMGCGSSGGVPRIGNVWGACDPENPKNRRKRCALLVERIEEGKTTRIVIDVGPDFRQQMLENKVSSVDGVLLTHAHADHIHGLDDLRPIVIHKKKRIDVYMDEITKNHVLQGFSYCFIAPEGSNYPPILNAHRMDNKGEITITGEGGNIKAQSFSVNHGDSDARAIIINKVAYIPDIKYINESDLNRLKGLEMLIIDALRYTPHVSHFNVDDALKLIKTVQPKRAILTNLHIDLDYETLSRELPKNCEPAYDNLSFEVPICK